MGGERKKQGRIFTALEILRMKINNDNYEAYFIDYLEGNLDELLVNDFIEFLQNNPDLKEELSLFKTVSVEPENISFNQKEKLYKEKYDAEKEFNNAVIASLEGDITTTDKSELEYYIVKHPEKKRDVVLFSKTKLQPDETILFNKKKKLYHYSLGKTFLLWSGRVAAILILAFAFFTLFNKSTNNGIPKNQVAVVEDKKVVNPEEKITSVEINKKEPIKDKTVSPKPVIKETKPQEKPNKSLRESTKGRLTHEDVVLLRIPVEVPTELSGITASMDVQQAKTTLATIHIVTPDKRADYYEERLLADVVKEKTGLDNFQFNKITKAGLNLVSAISKDKFKYETNEEGKITEYKYDSRLLAFSIPSKNTDSE